MRLPWPFGRVQRSPSSGDDASEASDPSGASGPGASTPPDRAPGDAWRRLPPLAETMGPPPLVAPNKPFAAALASSEPPAPILAPLSHGRSLEAPRGLVSGIARPASPVAAPALPAPVQRSPLGARRAGADDRGGWLEATDGPEPEVAPSPPLPAAPAPDPSPPAPRRLEAVVATTPSRERLTRAPQPAGAGLIGLVGQPRTAGSAPKALPAAVTAIQRSPATPEPESKPAATAAPAAPRPPIAAAPRLTIGQARRLGLGAPVAGGPVSSSTPVFTGGLPGAGPIAETARAPLGAPAPTQAPGIQRSPKPDAGAARDALSAAEPPEMPLLARVPSPAAGGAPVPAEPGRAPTDHLVPQPSPAPPVRARPVAGSGFRVPGMATTPIVSSTPLRTRVQRAPLTIPQRAPDDAGAGGAAALPGASAPSGTGPVKVHRDGTASELSSAFDARSFTHGGEIFLPASHGPLTSGTGKALLAHELTHVAQQRRLGSSLPPEHTSHGQGLEAEAVAAERTPDLTLALPQSSEKTAPPSSTSPGGPAFAADPSASQPPPGTQRAPATKGPTKPEPDATGGSSSKSGHTHTEQELEVLAHQLYHRIGRHLRRELLVDRERVGFALDLP